jgi:deazaflavin-dependent oxidoreductase (nitroreductase family)
MAFEGTDELLQRTLAFVRDHRSTYLSSGGVRGHIMDLTHAGARGLLPTLLLKTSGRRTGKALIVPLIYGIYGDEWVVVGSKGGALTHPAWFLNLEARPEVSFQVATQAFRASWRLAEGNERTPVWAYMEHLYPPYATYLQAAGNRTIPLVMLRPIEPIAVFLPDDGR